MTIPDTGAGLIPPPGAPWDPRPGRQRAWLIQIRAAVGVPVQGSGLVRPSAGL
jgi:hypothetical protein